MPTHLILCNGLRLALKKVVPILGGPEVWFGFFRINAQGVFLFAGHSLHGGKDTPIVTIALGMHGLVLKQCWAARCTMARAAQGNGTTRRTTVI